MPFIDTPTKLRPNSNGVGVLPALTVNAHTHIYIYISHEPVVIRDTSKTCDNPTHLRATRLRPQEPMLSTHTSLSLWWDLATPSQALTISYSHSLADFHWISQSVADCHRLSHSFAEFDRPSQTLGNSYELLQTLIESHKLSLRHTLTPSKTHTLKDSHTISHTLPYSQDFHTHWETRLPAPWPDILLSHIVLTH